MCKSCKESFYDRGKAHAQLLESEHRDPKLPELLMQRAWRCLDSHAGHIFFKNDEEIHKHLTMVSIQLKDTVFHFVERIFSHDIFDGCPPLIHYFHLLDLLKPLLIKIDVVTRIVACARTVRMQGRHILDLFEGGLAPIAPYIRKHRHPTDLELGSLLELFRCTVSDLLSVIEDDLWFRSIVTDIGPRDQEETSWRYLRSLLCECNNNPYGWINNRCKAAKKDLVKWIKPTDLILVKS